MKLEIHQATRQQKIHFGLYALPLILHDPTQVVFFVEQKKENQIANIFIHDSGNNLKNLSPNTKVDYDNTILAKSGVVKNKKLLLFNGKII